MRELRITVEAKGDLADIWWFVEQNNESAFEFCSLRCASRLF
jgi:hypothetical protein